ncbi:MAG: response regulator [Alistipes sp.]|nr:response regulator [Alistipes sp.]
MRIIIPLLPDTTFTAFTGADKSAAPPRKISGRGTDDPRSCGKVTPGGRNIAGRPVRNGAGLLAAMTLPHRLTILPAIGTGAVYPAVIALLICLLVFVAWKAGRRIRLLRRALQSERRKSDQKLHTFHNLSHEFKTPLTMVRGAIESLSMHGRHDADTDKLLETLSAGSRRLMGLAEQLQQLSHGGEPDNELNLQYTEAVAFFRGIYDNFRDIAHDRDIDYGFVTNREQREILLDRKKMDKIAYNLLAHSFDGVPDGGAVRMQLNFSEEENTFMLNISDSGSKGQGSDAGPQAGGGASIAGLSLPVISEVALSHCGYHEYDCRSELGGASLSVYLPMSDDSYDKEWISEIAAPGMAILKDKAAETGAEPTHALLKPLKEYKILIIEDEVEIREMVCDQLGKYFTVLDADNGTAGLEAASAGQPDLVICDVMMPGLSGFEVAAKLKSDFATSHMPVILLTGHVSDEYQLIGAQAGADAYIAKPFSIKLLYTRIVKFIEQREHLQQKFSHEPGARLSTESDRDKAFFNKLHELIEANLRKHDLTVDELMKGMGMSRNAFYQKVKGVTGQTPNEYLRTVRLKKAAGMFSDPELNVSEVAYRVGFDDPLYFSKCFKASFGRTPTQYRNDLLGK